MLTGLLPAQSRQWAETAKLPLYDSLSSGLIGSLLSE